MKARVGQMEIAYDRAGSGIPVLLVMGLAVGRIGWAMQIQALSEHYDVVCFDNRGIGESTCPDCPWSMDDMVNDVTGLADILGFERFHLVGVSMGGMISQEVTLRSPQRIRSLTLISTHHGGPDHVLPEPHAMTVFGSDASAEERVRRGIEITFGRRFREENPEFIDMMTRFGLSHGPPTTTVESQALAVGVWSNLGGASDRVGDIRVPTLVMHGEADELIPAGNGELLASKIPDAKLITFPDAGHALIQERAEEVNEAILQHLRSADGRTA